MAMDPTGVALASQVMSAMGYPGAPTPQLIALCHAIVTYIQTNASISGVAAGLVAPPSGGPVTGTLVVPPGGIL